MSVLSRAGAAAFRSDSPVEDNEDDGQLQQQSNGPSSGAEAEAAVAAALAKLPATPRLRTRLFAAELLLSLFAAVGPDSRHKHSRPKYGDTAGAGSTQEIPDTGG